MAESVDPPPGQPFPGRAEHAGRLPPRDLLLVLAVCAVWGLNFIPIRWALDEVPPFALASLRFLLAAFPLAFLVPRPRLPIGAIVAYGLVIGVAQFGLLFLAIRLGLAAGLASLLMQMQMFFTVALAAAWTGDRVRPAQVGGALVSCVGVALLAWDLLAEGAGATALGLVLIGLSSFSWAFGNVLAKAMGQRHSFDMFGLVVWSSLAAPLPLAALSWTLEGGPAPFVAIANASLATWASVLFMAYAATVFGYGTWNRLLRKHPAALVSPFTMLVPVFGLAGGVLVLHERLGPLQWGAAVIVLAGIGFAYAENRAASQRPERNPDADLADPPA